MGSQSSTRKRERWPDGWDTIVSPTAESTTWATWPDSAGTERTRSLDRGRQSSEKSAIFNASFASWPPPTCPHRKGLSDSEGPVFAKTLSGAPCPPPVPLGKFSHKRACSDATGLAKSSFTTNKYPLEAPSLMHLTAEAWTPWPRGICENGHWTRRAGRARALGTDGRSRHGWNCMVGRYVQSLGCTKGALKAFFCGCITAEQRFG